VPPRRKPPTALARLITLVWRQPLFAIPFGIFFGLLFGRGRSDYVGAYIVSLVFAYSIAIAIWSTTYFLVPVLQRRNLLGGRNAGLVEAGLYFVVAVLGSFAAALIVHLTIVPGFLGSMRSILVAGTFTMLFAALFIGVNMANYYYRQSLDRARAEQELTLARRIQRSFLLTQFPSLPRLEVHAVNLSSKEVSGDFYDVVPGGNGSHLLAIADVAGKGVPAALLTSMLQASLRTQAGSEQSVAEILRNINRLAYRSTTVQQFATFFLARVDENSLRFSYSNAGHNYPVLFRADGGRELLVRGGVVVGILEDASFEEESLALRAGDRVVFYTDGVSEATDPHGEMFGEERLHTLVESLPRDLDARQITDRIVEAVHRFIEGVEADDDITVMVLKVLEPGAAGSTPAAVPAAS
jgi:serine phosphatase RsbU (regulator of sigma subunit)